MYYYYYYYYYYLTEMTSTVFVPATLLRQNDNINPLPYRAHYCNSKILDIVKMSTIISSLTHFFTQNW